MQDYKHVIQCVVQVLNLFCKLLHISSISCHAKATPSRGSCTGSTQGESMSLTAGRDAARSGTSVPLRLPERLAVLRMHTPDNTDGKMKKKGSASAHLHCKEK